MENISYCRYRTSPSWGAWTHEQYVTQGIVKAIKGEPFGGYRAITVSGVTRRLLPGDQNLAIDWFVEAVVDDTEFDDGLYSLVPIPDRNLTPTATHTGRTLLIAQKLVAGIPGKFDIWDHLRFRKPIPEKTRDEDFLFTNMVCTSNASPTGYVILLDDVCTSGAHARAAGRKLAQLGVQDICSMSVARTMKNPDEELFGFREDDLRPAPKIIFGKASS